MKLTDIFKSLKSIVILALAIILIIIAIDYLSVRSSNKKLLVLNTELTLKNNMLDSSKTNLEADLKALSLERYILSSKIDKKNDTLSMLRKENKWLHDQLANIPGDVGEIPVEESYQFLINTAYPSIGDLKFPFNETQVKEIRIDYQENTLFKSIINNQEKQINTCQSVLTYKDSTIVSLQESLGKSSDIIKNREEKLANKDAEIKAKDKALKKKNIGKNIFKTVSIAEAIFILVKFVL